MILQYYISASALRQHTIKVKTNPNKVYLMQGDEILYESVYQEETSSGFFPDFYNFHNFAPFSFPTF